jgi:hypothetical protein
VMCGKTSGFAAGGPSHRKCTYPSGGSG